MEELEAVWSLMRKRIYEIVEVESCEKRRSNLFHFPAPAPVFERRRDIEILKFPEQSTDIDS